MRLLYNFLICIYLLLIKISSLFNEKSSKWLKGRKKWIEYAVKVNPDNKKLVWFHCASLGEFEQGRPVIEKFKQQFPEWKILISFFSPSGYEIRKNYEIADYIMYLPIDTPSNAKRFVEIIKPSLAFFVKYEFWFNYINQLNKNKIPVIYFSSIFRPSQYFFKCYGRWYRKQLKKIDWFFVQNRQSIELLNSIGINNCSISGDTRFDRVMQAVNTVKDFKELEKFSKNRLILLSGSTWPEDENLLAKVFDNLPENVAMIIAPHNVDDEHIKNIMKRFNNNIIKLSDFNNIKNYQDYKILLIDGMGFLLHLYRYAYVAYIGGGFGKSIHNILEAAAFGKPVIFGPNYHKFKEACDLIDLKGAFCVHNTDELQNILTNFFVDKYFYDKTSKICSEYVKNNCGATEIILKKSLSLL